MQTDIDMTIVVFLALFGAMALTICVAALVAKAIEYGLDAWDRHQYSKAIVKLYRF